MRRFWTRAAAALIVAAAGCREAGPPAAGRWERAGNPREWVELRRDGTFEAQGLSGRERLHGTYTQAGDTVTITFDNGNGGPIVFEDTLLVMRDGTRLRRAR